ncbi:MAG TPA: PQQ-binding-like beta-propeller repeat protein [Candidatus Nanoarchaeia archaeon]|nr:PQQ-binding-like beta-propeller repeat protein [Candidatus Nanoarchaeia archaeon]
MVEPKAMMKLMKTVLLMTVVALLTALCSYAMTVCAQTASSSGDDWSMFNHDLAHTGYSTSSAPATNQTLWTFTTGGAIETSPAVVDGTVYFGSDDGSVYALNAATGTLVWNYSTGGPVQSSPAVVNDVVYVGGFHSHAVFALNASSGGLIWRSSTNSVYPNEISSTAVTNGFVYVDVYNAGEGGEFSALNASTGGIVWKYDTEYWITNSPAIYEGIAYFGTNFGELLALNSSTGQTIWTLDETSNGGVQGSVSASDDLVFVGLSQKVQALNASSGVVVWSSDIVGGVQSSSPAVANGIVYVSMAYGQLYGGVSALNETSGTLMWNQIPGSITDSSPAIADGVVFVGSDDGSIHALNATTGTIIWAYTTGEAVYSSPAVAYGAVYVGSNDGKLYAIGTRQGPSNSSMPSTTPTYSAWPSQKPTLNKSPTPFPPNSIPEFSTWIILPLVLTTMLTAIADIRRKHAKSKVRFL